MRPTRSSSLTPPAGWNPGRTGHALFCTRLGVCGLAWGVHGVVAVMLPDASADITRDRVLASANKRHQVDWRQALSASNLSTEALQTVAGVQWLLAGAPAGNLAEASWAYTQPQLTAAGMVLPDLRSQLNTQRWAANGLPLLDDLVLDWHGVPDFAQHVYLLARAIAPGQTRSYGDLAEALGGKTLARAVGQALGANPFAPVVPCHRILANHGAAGGFSASGGTLTKLSMLEFEGAVLGDDSSLPLFG